MPLPGRVAVLVWEGLDCLPEDCLRAFFAVSLRNIDADTPEVPLSRPDSLRSFPYGGIYEFAGSPTSPTEGRGVGLANCSRPESTATASPLPPCSLLPAGEKGVIVPDAV